MTQINRNYQKELDRLIDGLKKNKRVPKLLLHSCCAPCSSYVLEYLAEYFEITVYYYNPNIFPEAEYEKRVLEQQYLIGEMKTRYPISFLSEAYRPEEFYEAVRGVEHIPEGGERCFRCYALRLKRAAGLAAAKKFDYFTTTLSISPMKNAPKLNEIGEALGREYGIPYLVSDFKKRNGYKRSVELSGEYGLYRQDYCGCVFSSREREKKQLEV